MAVSGVIGKAVRDGKQCYYINDGVYHTFSGVIFDHIQYHFNAFKRGATQVCAVFGRAGRLRRRRRARARFFGVRLSCLVACRAHGGRRLVRVARTTRQGQRDDAPHYRPPSGRPRFRPCTDRGE